PGNYTLRNDDGEALAWFSINLPPEESDLTKVPTAEIEAVLGPNAVLADVVGGQISHPLEMLPSVMLVLLFLLAVENLLANKFYRREPAPPLGMDKEPST